MMFNLYLFTFSSKIIIIIIQSVLEVVLFFNCQVKTTILPSCQVNKKKQTSYCQNALTDTHKNYITVATFKINKINSKVPKTLHSIICILYMFTPNK